jgi:hypothetical protein
MFRSLHLQDRTTRFELRRNKRFGHCLPASQIRSRHKHAHVKLHATNSLKAKDIHSTRLGINTTIASQSNVNTHPCTAQYARNTKQRRRVKRCGCASSLSSACLRGADSLVLGHLGHVSAAHDAAPQGGIITGWTTRPRSSLDGKLDETLVAQEQLEIGTSLRGRTFSSSCGLMSLCKIH